MKNSYHIAIYQSDEHFLGKWFLPGTHFILLGLRKTDLVKLPCPWAWRRIWTDEPLITHQEHEPLYISLFSLCYTDVHYEIDSLWICWKFVHYTQEKVTNNNLNTCLPPGWISSNLHIWKMNNSTNVFQGIKWMKFGWISSINVISPLGFLQNLLCFKGIYSFFVCIILGLH